MAERQLRKLPGGEVVRASRLPEFLRGFISLVAVVVGLFLVYTWLTFVLNRFPYSRPWGEALRGFLLEQISQIGLGILEAIPGLFTVLLILVVARFAARLAGQLFDAVERGRLDFPGVHRDTAQTTRRLVTGLLWMFASVAAYPYLPGAETDAFKGLSVFVGLMLSLGSSGIVNQVMSGLTIIYSRAVRHGDFVRIGDVEGTVTGVGMLSTKVKTPLREELTIPNSVVMSTVTTNYSRLHASEGVFVSTSVTIGYGVPWRQVHALLLLAAERTTESVGSQRQRFDRLACATPMWSTPFWSRWRTRRCEFPSSMPCTRTFRMRSTSSACRSWPRTTRATPKARRSFRLRNGLRRPLLHPRRQSGRNGRGRPAAWPKASV
jgi:small-conductance mechanosensitive channel